MLGFGLFRSWREPQVRGWLKNWDFTNWPMNKPFESHSMSIVFSRPPHACQVKTKDPIYGRLQMKAPVRTERTEGTDAVDAEDEGGFEIIDLVLGKLALAPKTVSRTISLEMMPCSTLAKSSDYTSMGSKPFVISGLLTSGVLSANLSRKSAIIESGICGAVSCSRSI